MYRWGDKHGRLRSRVQARPAQMYSIHRLNLAITNIYHSEVVEHLEIDIHEKLIFDEEKFEILASLKELFDKARSVSKIFGDFGYAYDLLQNTCDKNIHKSLTLTIDVQKRCSSLFKMLKIFIKMVQPRVQNERFGEFKFI